MYDWTWFQLNGKQKAYVINQNDMPTANPEELAKLDAEVRRERCSRNSPDSWLLFALPSSKC